MRPARRRVGPKAIEAHFKDYEAFIDESIATAPPAVAYDWNVYGTAIKTVRLPVLEKYGFSYEKVNPKGTEAEKAIFDGKREVRLRLAEARTVRHGARPRDLPAHDRIDP